MQSLAEQYRPRSLDDVAGQDKAVRVLKALAVRGFGGRALWITGASGTGKTTLARIVAAEIASDWVIEEIDAGELTSARVRDIWSGFACYGPGKGGRALICNEAHILDAKTITSLLVELERIPSHCVVVFTTTTDGLESFIDKRADAGALLSRCILLPLSRSKLAAPFAERVLNGARAAGLAEPETTLEQAVKLLQECRNNCRAAWQAVESGALL